MPATPAQLRAILLDEINHTGFPTSTYRLQFHRDFTFQHASALVPYLHALGITHAYASPILKARPGSQHGYDITDHRQLNPEIGSEADFGAWTDALHRHDMGVILDIVPNHMAVVGNDNSWWNDILETGPSSPFAEYFDIAWLASPRPELQGRILIPILGEPYAKVLEAQQLCLHFDAGAFSIHYLDHRFPVALRSYGLILGHNLAELEKALAGQEADLHEYQSVLTAVKHLPARTETNPELVAELHREKEVIKRRLAALAQNPAIRDFIEQTLAAFNGRPNDPASFDLMEALLDDQNYRLAFWRVAAEEINYRRFFDVNELAALSMERPDVFAATHELIVRLLVDGKVNGLRIDHPDGLYDPRQYLQRLQRHFLIAKIRSVAAAQPHAGAIEESDVAAVVDEWLREARAWPLYVVVEKILGAEETLAEDWPTHGTSGYDFLNLVNSLFVNSDNSEAFTRLFRDWVQDDTSFPELVYQKKILILQIALSSELQMLGHQFDRLAQKHRWSRDFTRYSLRQALREIIACFPIYRSYIASAEINDSDRKHVVRAVRRAMARYPALSTALFHFVRDTLLLKSPGAGSGEADFAAEQLHFVRKFQQVTGPVMAKGAEDTACYVYNRLISLNEVGGNPDHFGLEPATLHRAFQARRQRHPWAMSATSTHDTKRGEDVRARINVLSELPHEWQDRLTRWSKLNQPHRIALDDAPAPDPNEEYFLYQTLIGAWPIEPCSAEEFAAFVGRVQAYMVKALHEAKVHTSWINPNTAYDEAAQQFVAAILDGEKSGEFLTDFRDFQRQVSQWGCWNSLAQTVLKIAVPGVPDFYQGTELWDLNLVDPDNRRPVDFDRRQSLLQEIEKRIQASDVDRGAVVKELLETKDDGRVKLFVTCQGLRCRRDHPHLFSQGEYVSATANGPSANHVFGFLRRHESTRALVVVPRLLVGLISWDQSPCQSEVWQDTTLVWPDEGPPRRWRNVFTKEIAASRQDAGTHVMAVQEVFRSFPVAILLAEPE